jgi:hypothetical protein
MAFLADRQRRYCGVVVDKDKVGFHLACALGVVSLDRETARALLKAKHVDARNLIRFVDVNGHKANFSVGDELILTALAEAHKLKTFKIFPVALDEDNAKFLADEHVENVPTYPLKCKPLVPHGEAEPKHFKHAQAHIARDVAIHRIVSSLKDTDFVIGLAPSVHQRVFCNHCVNPVLSPDDVFHRRVGDCKHVWIDERPVRPWRDRVKFWHRPRLNPDEVVGGCDCWVSKFDPDFHTRIVIFAIDVLYHIPPRVFSMFWARYHAMAPVVVYGARNEYSSELGSIGNSVFDNRNLLMQCAGGDRDGYRDLNVHASNLNLSSTRHAVKMKFRRVYEEDLYPRTHYIRTILYRVWQFITFRSTIRVQVTNMVRCYAAVRQCTVVNIEFTTNRFIELENVPRECHVSEYHPVFYTVKGVDFYYKVPLNDHVKLLAAGQTTNKIPLMIQKVSGLIKADETIIRAVAEYYANTAYVSPVEPVTCVNDVDAYPVTSKPIRVSYTSRDTTRVLRFLRGEDNRGLTPGMFANNVHNELVGISGRVLMVTPPPVVRAWLNVSYHMQTYAARLAAVTWSPEQYIEALKGPKKEEAERSYDKILAGAITASDVVPVYSAFVKREFSLTYEESLFKEPRIIQSADSLTKFYLSLWTYPFSEVMKTVFNPDSHLCYASGLTPLDVGLWFDFHTDRLGATEVLETDFSRWDAHLCPEALNNEIALYALCGCEPKTVGLFNKAKSARVYSKHGNRYVPRQGRHSGDANTSCGNTLLNIMLHEYYFLTIGYTQDDYALIALGDDMLALLAHGRQFDLQGYLTFTRSLGMKVKSAVRPRETASFCSQFFWSVTIDPTRYRFHPDFQGWVDGLLENNPVNVAQPAAPNPHGYEAYTGITIKTLGPMVGRTLLKSGWVDDTIPVMTETEKKAYLRDVAISRAPGIFCTPGVRSQARSDIVAAHLSKCPVYKKPIDWRGDVVPLNMKPKDIKNVGSLRAMHDDQWNDMVSRAIYGETCNELTIQYRRSVRTGTLSDYITRMRALEAREVEL